MVSETTVKSTVVIRDARLDDSAGISSILYILGWHEHVQQQPVAQTQVQIAQRIARCQREQTHTILIAEHEHVVVGYLALHWFPNLAMGLDGYISELFLRPDARGQGIGGRLLNEAEQRARKRGCQRLMLLNRRNRESYQRGFYSKHGWKEMEDGAFFTLKLS